MPIAVYPGTFDPPTQGHLDLIRRGSRIFDALVIGVGTNIGKSHLFSVTERVGLVSELVRELPNVSVRSFSGLAVAFAREQGAQVILRGTRTYSDFEYEFQMALTNRTFDPAVETVFMMPSLEYSFTSSRLIKEAASLGGDVSALVPPLVAEALTRKLRKMKKGKK